MKRILISGFIFALLLPVAVSAQSDDADARAVVLQAVANLEDGYVFSGTSDLAQTFTDDEHTYTTFTSIAVDGTINANGDYHFTTNTTTAETLPELETTPPFEMELVWVNDQLSVRFDTENTIYESQYPEFTPEWHGYESLLAEIDDPVRKLSLEALINVPTPSKVLLTDDLIEAVTEQEPESMDGVDLRIFDVEMNALESFASQSPAMSLEDVLKSAGLITASEFDLTYTLYIGAEDGQLYRIVGAGRTFVPYFTEGYDDGPPYNLEMASTVGFDLTQHGEAGEIEPVDGGD